MKYEFEAKNSGTLSSLLSKIKNEVPYTKINSALRKKDIKVNGKKTNDKNLNINVGDKIEIFYTETQIKINTVYEDDNILVVFKPFGIETTAQDKQHNSKSLEEIMGYPAVHRLDMFTEGLVILAKNRESEVELLNAIKNHKIEKYYTALCYGKFSKKQELSNAYHYFDNATKTAKISSAIKKGYTKIQTEYCVASQKNNLALVNIKLITGKTHQIRAHMAHINHFIIGDQKYGDTAINKTFKFKHQCLSATKLVFNFNKSSYLFYLNDNKIYSSPTWLNKINI